MVGRVYLERYEALRLLGEGGMGKVYLARQIDLGRQVVVKVMHDHIAADSMFRDRFQRETLLMARFQHPYAVTLYDASLNDPNGPCIIMEYVRGTNLETILQKNGKFAPARITRFLSQLCEVLDSAHQEGIVHRDLKPANLMIVDFDSPREKIKVMDFGLAKLVHPDKSDLINNTSISQVEFAVGTPGYISPEQVRGEPSDHRADIYSVGVILYELLTGRLPFKGTSTMDVLLAHATELPPRFHDLDINLNISRSIEQVVFSCLEKDPNNRPQTALDLANAFEVAIGIEDFEDDQSEWETEPEIPAIIDEPDTLTFRLEAWMPESIAILKLRGFVQDVQGEIIESIPGLIRVRIGSPQKSSRGSGVFSLLGLGRKDKGLNIELYLHQLSPDRGNQLLIQVTFRPSNNNELNDPVWRQRCNNIFVELRSFLIATQLV